MRQSQKPSLAKVPRFEPSTKPLGILGGGQLARMLAIKAHELGVPVSIYSEKADDPAAQVVQNWHQGSLNDRSKLETFLKDCSVVTFESEFLDANLLSELSQKTKTAVFPKPSEMASLQDRLTQKELLLKFNLPTADYRRVDSATDAQEAFTQFKGAVVFKKRRFGYDGYGTFVVRNEKELKAFLPEISKNEFGFIAEKFVKFRREVAVMAARSRNGETVLLPFVETFQENSRCLWVKGPLPETSVTKKLKTKLTKFLSGVDYVGVMGIELFDLGGEYSVNEIAPRVHNSGHYSLEALKSDQFSLHLKSVIGLELGRPSLLASGFAMMNLLGSHSQSPSWDLPSHVKLHWYGKAENRPGRKMGHITALAASPAIALKTVLKERAKFKV